MKKERIEILRQLMREEHLSALVIPGSYPHGDDSIPVRWNAMAWLTGEEWMTATIVLTQEHVAVWTAGSCYSMLAKRLDGTGIELNGIGEWDVSLLSSWLGDRLKDAQSPEVGLDGMSCSASFVGRLISDLRNQGGITVRTNVDILQRVWKHRPEHPTDEVRVYQTVPSVKDKLELVRRALRQQHADGMLVSKGEDVAWVLNLKTGLEIDTCDVPAYLLIAQKKATLFIDKKTLSSEVLMGLGMSDIDIEDYEKVVQGLHDYFELNILMDPKETPYALSKAVRREVISGTSPVPALKGGGEVPKSAPPANEETQSVVSPKRKIPAYQPKRPSGCLAAAGWVLFIIGTLMIGLGIFGIVFSLSGDDEVQHADLITEPVDVVDSVAVVTDSISALTDDEDFIDSTAVDSSITFEIDSITGDTIYVEDDIPYENPFREDIQKTIGVGLGVLLILFGLIPFIPGMVMLLIYYQNRKRYRKWLESKALQADN